MVLIPEGWLAFNGGGSDPSLCTSTPGAPIVPSPSAPELKCDPDGYIITINVTGGILPLIWATSGGTITVTGGRSATLDIGNNAYLGDYDEKVGSIAFFKPHMFTFASQVTTPTPHCSGQAPNSYYREATVDVRLRSYDCLKRHITELIDFGSQTDVLAPDSTAFLLEHPIGDNPADRGCTLAVDWPFVDTPTPSHPLSDPAHFSVSATGCGLNDPGNASVHVTAALAGKNGVHGPINAGAPAYNQTMNVVLDQVGPLDIPPIRDTDFPASAYMDVRTQVQVDTDCCVVPAGTDITVTVIDAGGGVAVIVIPVVEPTP